MAKFRFILSMDKDKAIHLPWSHVKAALNKLYAENIGGLKPIVNDELPKSNPKADYTYEVTVKD